VQAVLGKPLDKRQQRSDWAAGELSTEQVRYAVNDAHVLLSCYDALVTSHLAESGAAAAATPIDDPVDKVV
jgi:ribonuclease D